MANAYVNFYARLAPEGAQAFWGRASQAHLDDAAVGADVGGATAIALDAATQYAEVCPTDGAVFACILPSGSSPGARTAARIRIDEGDRITLSRGGYLAADTPVLYLWAV